jgi:hypothetical protein
MDIYFCPFFKFKKEFQKNKKIFRFFSIPKNCIFSFSIYRNVSFWGMFWNIFAITIQKKRVELLSVC